MKRSKPPLDLSISEELSDTSLRDAAGALVYERGLAYAADNRVRLLRDDGAGATFDVIGTRTYRIELYFEDLGLHVDCTCPHAQEGSFCKHMVAAAVMWRQHLGGGEAPKPQAAPPDARSSKAAQTRAANRERLKAFVYAQPAVELANRLWKQAEIDSYLMKELRAWAASARANDHPKALQEAVNELLAFSAKRIIYGREVWAWAERARQVEPLLRAAIERSPETARLVSERALRRVYAASQYADDSDGEIGAVMQMIIAIILDAVQRAPPPAAWASRFLDLLDEDPIGIWDVDQVLELAGGSVATAFSARVAQRWDEVDQKDAKDPERDHARERARELMLSDFRRRGDVAAGLDFMKRTARGLFEHADLIRTFEHHGRHRDALQIAQAACKAFNDHPIVEDLLLEAYQRDGWDEEAFQIRQRRFAARPSVTNYQALLAAAEAAKKDIVAIRAWAYAEAAASERAPSVPYRRGRADSADRARRDVSATAAMLLHDGEVARALELVQPPNVCDPRLLEAVAEHLPNSVDAAAFALLDRVLRAEMRHAQTPYTAALRAVSLALARLNSEQRKEYLGRLRLEFKAKRNFIAGLP
jgi:hypothetical protein